MAASLVLKHFSFFVLCFSLSPASGQSHAKCADAIEIDTSVSGPFVPEGLSDSSLCVPNNQTMYFGKKHKVFWLTFLIPYDTVMTFDIVPDKPSDDFDFILFRADRGDFCTKETQRKIKPLRTNFAKPTEYNKGVTGLSAKGTQEMVEPGFNPSYSSPVQVKKGERYYIAVDNYKDDRNAFTLILHFRFNTNPNPMPSHIDAMPVAVPKIKPISNPNFIIHVLDSANHPIKANLIIDGFQPGKSIHIDTSDYSLKLKPYQTLKIRANAKGHMPYQSSYSSTGDTSSTTFLVRLQPIESAQKITLKDIQFQQDSHTMVPESKQALDYLLQFLLANPTVNIIIKGYVNDPDNTQTQKYDQVLSETRANAVRDYLASHGVYKERMQTIGYGSSKMLYPRPINEDQSAANRRVEIEIK